MNKELNDLILRQKVEKVFITKEGVNVNEPNVIAAIITAASAMSRESNGIITPDMTTMELLDLYNKVDDEDVTNLIGMSSSYVNLATGYNVEFENMQAAMGNYRSNKNSYDEIYTKLSNRALTHETNISR